MTKEQKKLLFGFGLPIILGTILLLGASYAWLQLTLNGTKTNVLKVGDLSLELDDTNGVAINGDGVLPVLDEVGLLQDPYHFTLTNNGTLASKYTIYLDNVNLESGEKQLPDEAIKFDLKKDDTTLIRTLLSYIKQDNVRILDTGVINGEGESFEYDLRMWVDEAATQDMAAGKTFRGKIRVEAQQVIEQLPTPEECFTIDETGTITSYLCGSKILDVNQASETTNTAENSPAGRIITDVVIPKTINGTAVTKIDYGSFGGAWGSTANVGLTSVAILEGVTSIDEYAFANNPLTKVTFPSTLREIGNLAFSDTLLNSIKLPEGLMTIGNSAFYNNRLTSIVIPASVTSLSNAIFGNNPLTSVTIKGKISIEDFDIYGYSYRGYLRGPFYGSWPTVSGSICQSHHEEHKFDSDGGDNTNPCIHWEP